MSLMNRSCRLYKRLLQLQTLLLEMKRHLFVNGDLQEWIYKIFLKHKKLTIKIFQAISPLTLTVLYKNKENNPSLVNKKHLMMALNRT